MTYTVYWYRYPHGVEGEEMDCKWRDFSDIGKAINFLNRRMQLISSLNWAGGHIEDQNGKWVYEITDYGEVEDKTK